MKTYSQDEARKICERLDSMCESFPNEVVTLFEDASHVPAVSILSTRAIEMRHTVWRLWFSELTVEHEFSISNGRVRSIVIKNCKLHNLGFYNVECEELDLAGTALKSGIAFVNCRIGFVRCTMAQATVLRLALPGTTSLQITDATF